MQITFNGGAGMTCKDCVYFKRCVVLGVELDMHRLRFASTCKDGRLTG